MKIEWEWEPSYLEAYQRVSSTKLIARPWAKVETIRDIFEHYADALNYTIVDGGKIERREGYQSIDSGAVTTGKLCTSTSGNGPGGADPLVGGLGQVPPPPPSWSNKIILTPGASYTHGNWTHTNTASYDVELDLSTGVMTPLYARPSPPPRPTGRMTATEALMRLNEWTGAGDGCPTCFGEVEHKVFSSFEYDYCPKCKKEV